MNTLDSVRKPPHSKCYGVEIEGFLLEDVADKWKFKFKQFWYTGRDGSLSYSPYNTTGVEFVSQPLPYHATIKQINWLAKRVTWQWNESCGIHVHVSRKGVSSKRLVTLAIGLPKITPDQCAQLFGRPPNDYCQNKFSMTGRYSMINFTNNHTIEFRMFSGGDAAWVKECVRRVRLLINYKGKVDYDSLLELFTRPE